MDDQYPESTPLDIRANLSRPEDDAFPLRWGILGAGNVSRQWVHALAACKGASVVAVGARELAKAQEFATRLNIPRAYGSYEALVADEAVDIIYVGTITRLHKDHTILALDAGKHVLCEKPLATNLADAEAMYEKAEEKHLMLQDAMWTRFFPAVEHVRTLVDSGQLGEIKMVQSDFFDPIYAIQTVPLAFGTDDTSIEGFVAGKNRSACIVEFSNGRSAVLSFPPFNSELPETTQIIGTKGRVTLEHPAHCPTDVSIVSPPNAGVPSRYRTRNIPAPQTRYSYPLPSNVSIPSPFPNQHGFVYQAEAIHRCLANELLICPQYDKQNSLLSLRILSHLYNS